MNKDPSRDFGLDVQLKERFYPVQRNQDSLCLWKMTIFETLLPYSAATENASRSQKLAFSHLKPYLQSCSRCNLRQRCQDSPDSSPRWELALSPGYHVWDQKHFPDGGKGIHNSAPMHQSYTTYECMKDHAISHYPCCRGLAYQLRRA